MPITADVPSISVADNDASKADRFANRGHGPNVLPLTSRPAPPISQQFLRATIAKFCRVYPLLSGCTQIANFSLLRHLTDQEEFVVSKLRDGSAIHLQLNDYGGRSMYYFGDYDPKITKILKKLLRPGDNVIDIGANFGLISLMAAKLVGPRGQVHAFEPQVGLASLIEAAAADNDYRHLLVHPIALSDADGEAEMFLSPGVTGAASLVRDDLAGVQSESVRVAAAGAYFDSLGLAKTRLVKIDVEGHEYTVLKAAEPWLSKHRPDAILFETQDYDTPLADRPVLRLLEPLGYEFYPITKSRLRFNLLPSESLSPWARDHAHDVLAVQPWRCSEILE
ncbi:FkbM family methyltransferase [Planctomycetes bacterium K23_9]|uniref:Methyltransferase domain protein n=1 Tax=Stieleria marina TaxID=1930275 RepID=A0A517NNS1_9BACT|nr:Methyltransferase domain protein [Planctomycetes bacterium K23_9]